FEDPRHPYTRALLAAVPSVIGAVLIIIFIKERKAGKLHRGIRFRDFDRNFLLFLVLSGIFALGYFSYSFFLVFASQSGFELTAVPILYLIFSLMAAVFSLPFGKLADRIGRKWVLWVAFALFGLAAWGFTLNPGFWGIILLFALYGIQRGAMEPVQRTYASELAPTQFRASALGAYQMVIGIMALPASVIAGLLWVLVGMDAPFFLSAVLSLIAIVMLIFVRETA
ncbi:MAG: MFS transporter, partial [Candidatus Aenigmatarchaeota archaeon]